jgi:hypothetical protein
LAEIFYYSGGRLPRSEDEHWQSALRSGNLWTAQTLALPEWPTDPSLLATASDERYLLAHFGKPEELETARQRARRGAVLGSKPRLLAAVLGWIGYGSAF